MFKTTVAWLSMAVLSAVVAFGDATIGSLDVRVGAALESQINQGRSGILVEARDVVVDGYEGKSLRFVAVAWKDDADTPPTDYLDVRATQEVSRWDTVSLELPDTTLQEAFGAGSHDIYVVFYIVDVRDGVPQTIPGSYYARPVTVDLKIKDLVDRHAVDREANERVIRAKFSRGPQYSSLLEVAGAYDLTIAVREFSMGSTATRRIYSWDSLEDVDDPLLDRYVATFVREWVKLPVDFVRHTGLRGIVFVKNLLYDGVRVGAGFDVDDRFIICGVNDSFRDEDIQHALFHEYMHIIDNLLCCRHFFDNDKWLALNHPQAEYSRKGALDMIREDFSLIIQDHPEPGFLNGYCLADIYQDKAEVFAYLLIAPYYRKASSWLSADPYLTAKFSFMKQALNAMSPAFTEEYFAQIHARE